MHKKTVLLLNDVDFWEGSSGHRTRIAALIAYLSDHVKLTVVNTGPISKIAEMGLNQTYKAEFYTLEYSQTLSSLDYGKRLRDVIKSRKFDAVIIEYIHSSYFLSYLNGRPRIILDAHDLISERTEQFKKFNYTGQSYELGWKREKEIFNYYDYVMVLSKPDAEKLKRHIGSRVLLCPHPAGIHTHTIRPEVRTITFIGSSYLPNVDAIYYFLSNCWAELSRKHPVQLLVYGTVCSAIKELEVERVVLKGFESSADLIYEEADLIINPVRFGAGLKIKNIEAIAHGRPLVTTTHGSRGLEALKNHGILIADDPAQFSKAVSYFIMDRQARALNTKKASEYVLQHLSPEKCFEPLLQVINKATI
jgi:glycosyltransferase involved in cell wall biosynthesis